ncbi:hypothetical protein K439DRAFT_1628510 [Ramaria rubella]|nr:hypothetical protein K439DRAFT_1628510 [Ramaria rubella]
MTRNYGDSPFIPPMPGTDLRGTPRSRGGVIPSPSSEDNSLPSSSDHHPYRMAGGYGPAYPGGPPMHTPAQWTPGGWGVPQFAPGGPMPGQPHPMHNGTPGWGYPGGYAPPPPPPGYGPQGFGHPYPQAGYGRGAPGYPHSAPYAPGPLPPGGYGPAPYPGYPVNGTPFGQPQGFPGGYFPTSVPMAPPPQLYDDMRHFPDGPTEDIMPVDKWAYGKHYAPVLTPFQLAILDAKLMVNPLLSPPGDNPPPDRPYINYNILFPVGSARRSVDPSTKSWSVGRHTPATWPRVSQLRIICADFPWVVEVNARDRAHGVTCIDVLQGIHDQLHYLVPRHQVEALTGVKGEAFKRKMYEVYHYNRSTARDAPGGSLGDGVRRVDCLLHNVMFEGLEDSPQFVREKLGIAGPGWKGLKTTAQKEQEKNDSTPKERLQGWPATLVLKLDLRYRDSEGDRESIISSTTVDDDVTVDGSEVT